MCFLKLENCLRHPSNCESKSLPGFPKIPEFPDNSVFRKAKPNDAALIRFILSGKPQLKIAVNFFTSVKAAVISDKFIEVTNVCSFFYCFPW